MKYMITKRTINHLSQPVRYTAAIDESYLQTAIENAILEGYTIISIKKLSRQL